MPAQPQFNQIETYRLYEAQFVADLAGISRRVVYDAAKNKRKISIPVVTRLYEYEDPDDDQGPIRFRGQHILEWLDRRAGIQPQTVEPVAIEPVKRGRGRPRKSAEAAV